jgi:hypothetical protein
MTMDQQQEARRTDYRTDYRAKVRSTLEGAKHPVALAFLVLACIGWLTALYLFWQQNDSRAPRKIALAGLRRI